MASPALLLTVIFGSFLSGVLLTPDILAASAAPPARPGAEAFARLLSAGGYTDATPASLPSSFVYGGQPSATLLATWPRQEKLVSRQGAAIRYEITWREPGGGLAATWTATEFREHPAMEIRWTFCNEGKIPAKPLTNVLALDLAVISPQASRALLHSVGGLEGDKLDSPRLAFALTDTPLGTVTLSAAAGRSSDKDLPFFVIHGTAPQAGLYVGLGWSGQWQAVVDGSQPGALKVTVEMPGMNLALPPGETIISPSVLVGSYRGPVTTGSNLLRQLIRDKFAAHLIGGPVVPPVSWNSWFILDNRISESTLEAQADLAARAGVEYFCIDAGWFDGDFPNGVGNWTVNTTKFPQGLKAIGDHVAKAGMKLGLWFEPERAAAGTRILREHPEWVHGDLVDLGNASAREWIFKMMTGFIDQGHVRWIRWDFNTDPLGNWNAADAPGQNGLTQIRHIMGLYELLDRLEKKYPDLLVEGCASGGRRIDLETIRRSHTFWKSDNTGDASFLQFHETGGETFLPGQLLNTNLDPASIPYDTDSILGGPFGLRCDWTKLSPTQLAAMREQVALAKRLRPLIDEDYYALFPQTRDQSLWTGWQFDSPRLGEGFVVLLRPPVCGVAAASVQLRGLDPAATYRIETVRGPSEPAQSTGAQMMEGGSVSLAPHTSAVYVYRKVK